MASMTLEQALQLGLQHHEAGRVAEAEAVYRQILAVDPDHPDVVHFLGAAALQQGRVEEAIEQIERAVVLNPEAITARYNLGNALRAKGRVDEAEASYRGAIERRAGFVEAWNNLGTLLKETGRVEEGVAALRRCVELSPTHAGAWSNLLLALHYDPRSTLASLAGEHRVWEERCAKSRGLSQRAFLNDRSPERKLRVGYVSADFQDHVVGRNILPLFRGHDRGQFEVVCYSGVVTEDAVTAEFRGLADVWRVVAGATNEQVAEQVRADRIDVLVDLGVHSANNRLLAFAEKPAPVQVTFAGYPGSTGLSAMDWRLTDAGLDPEGVWRDAWYAERSVRLASFWCYDVGQGSPAVNALPAAANGFVTFGCLNSFSKVNGEVLGMWRRVLGAVAGSRLVVLAPRGAARERVLAGLGVERGRVAFVETLPREGYLAEYYGIDCCLDTYPYNGHTTSLDALWMGVPVVSRAGETAVSRAGVSQMGNLGMGEWVSDSVEGYVRRAVEVAGGVAGLAVLRGTLRERMRGSVLTDVGGFVRGIEGAYRAGWRVWCAGTGA